MLTKIGIAKLSDDTDSVDVVITHKPDGFEAVSRVASRLKVMGDTCEIFVTEFESVSLSKTVNLEE